MAAAIRVMRSGSPGVSESMIIRHAKPKEHRPWTMGWSNFMFLAYSGSTWMRLVSPVRR